MKTTKIYQKCEQNFPLTSEFFYKRSRAKDGFTTYCKLCVSKATLESYRKRVSTEEGRAKARETTRKSQRKMRSTEEGRAKANEASRKMRSTEEGRAKRNEANCNWRKKYPEKNTANTVAYRAMKLESNPTYTGKPSATAWSNLEKPKIKNFYQEAQESNREVDHIIPLRPDELPFPWLLPMYQNRRDFPDFEPLHRKFQARYGLCCGLHVSANLQLLAQSENGSKGNQFRTYRETHEAIYILSDDGENWLPIKSEELDSYSWIQPQLYVATTTARIEPKRLINRFDSKMPFQSIQAPQNLK
ncbi:hypothetical protein V0288_19515 [Pannus brasiliensis CCIBt3594]|uniref:HNH homing endonuclease n=1 Tax=Pannus brasiliensis CCIBt3594 TaxID=1427578 RepID=A0AAW9QVV8_9CHRO